MTMFAVIVCKPNRAQTGLNVKKMPDEPVPIYHMLFEKETDCCGGPIPDIKQIRQHFSVLG
jgi:hypothetical protein